MPRRNPTMMPAKMRSDMPLPMPRSVICSPSHMTKQVPVVSVSTVIRRNARPGLFTSGSPPAIRAERKDRDLRKIAAGEHVVEAEHRVRRLARQLVDRGSVHAGNGDVVAQTVHAQQPEREQHAITKLRDLEDVLEAFHGFSPDIW